MADAHAHVEQEVEAPEVAHAPEDPDAPADAQAPQDPDPPDDARASDDADAPEDAEAPPELDPELRARRDAALRLVRTYGDPVLTTRARPVERFDDGLVAEIERMGRIMHEALGVGLAATQVGVLHRVLVYRVQHESPVIALVNPELEWAGKDAEVADEGCLSLPAVSLEVERPIHVRVRARDARGDKVVVEASGLEARVIQHEMDHLDGVLILDRASREDRKAAIRSLREAERAA